MARRAEDGLQEEVASGAYRRRTEEGLALGGFLLILVVGGLLTVVLLGVVPALIAVSVILLAGVLLLALYKGLDLLEVWLRRE